MNVRILAVLKISHKDMMGMNDARNKNHPDINFGFWAHAP